MSTTNIVTIGVTSDLGTPPLSGNASEVGNNEIPIDQTFAATSSAVAVTGVVFTAANLQSIFLVADKNCAITFTGPGNTVNLVAGTPFYWQKSAGYFANPFGANVTGATLTCTPAVRLRGKILQT